MTDGNYIEDLVFPTLLFVLAMGEQHTVHLHYDYYGEFYLCKVVAYLCWLLVDAKTWQHRICSGPKICLKM